MYFECKPDYEISHARYQAFWDRQIVDRPPVCFAFRREDAPPPKARPACPSWKDWWLDIDRRVDELAAGIASLFWVFQPEKLALGGGVSRAGEFLLTNVKRVLRDVYGQKNVDRVCLARHENDAGMLGAAALAEYHLK